MNLGKCTCHAALQTTHWKRSSNLQRTCTLHSGWLAEVRVEDSLLRVSSFCNPVKGLTNPFCLHLGWMNGACTHHTCTVHVFMLLRIGSASTLFLGMESIYLLSATKLLNCLVNWPIGILSTQLRYRWKIGLLSNLLVRWLVAPWFAAWWLKWTIVQCISGTIAWASWGCKCLSLYLVCFRCATFSSRICWRISDVWHNSKHTRHTLRGRNCGRWCKASV